jgi:hypothetical protein
MLHFEKEWSPDELQVRDLYQFQLKSEVKFDKNSSKHQFTQEFYLFVPKSLQINKKSYSKDEFYRDQTHFVRLKTPKISLEQLSNIENSKTPLYNVVNNIQVEHNLKLFGNCFRSALREKCTQLVNGSSILHSSLLELQLITLSQHISKVKKTFRGIKVSPYDHNTYTYLDEFLSSSIDYYLTALLSDLLHLNKTSAESTLILTSQLKQEKKYRHNHFQENFCIDDEKEETGEELLYKRKLLNKFILDCLLLKTNRVEPVDKMKNLIASIAAGVAMLIQVILLINMIKSSFLYNSIPFILATVLIYILKDRTKEVIKNIFTKKGRKYFPDFKTKITSTDKKEILGIRQENFSILSLKDLPEEIKNLRNNDFHNELKLFNRPEKIIYYRSNLNFNKKNNPLELNTLFRFNIWRFLSKAGNPYLKYHNFNINTDTIEEKLIPKTYHLNLIIKEYHPNKSIIYRKYRIVINKSGIKRVENMNLNSFQNDQIETLKKQIIIPYSNKTNC